MYTDFNADPGRLGPVRERITDDPWLFLAAALILSVVVYVVSLGLTEVIFRLLKCIRKGKERLSGGGALFPGIR